MIRKEMVDVYCDKLVGRIFKIIPLQEESCKTIDDYVNSIVRELIGLQKMHQSSELLAIIATLNNLDINDKNTLKSDVFKVIKLVGKIKERCV